jgi:hypothetical protein
LVDRVEEVDIGGTTLKLHLQQRDHPVGSTTSGYKCVYKSGNRYVLRVQCELGLKYVVGMFYTAVEAATRYAQLKADPAGFEVAVRRSADNDEEAFARRNEEEADRRELVREVNGFTLLLSPFTRAGYRYVCHSPSSSKPWTTCIELSHKSHRSPREHSGRCKSVCVGQFETPVQAALAIARYTATHCDDEWHRLRRTYPKVSQANAGAERLPVQGVPPTPTPAQPPSAGGLCSQRLHSDAPAPLARPQQATPPRRLRHRKEASYAESDEADEDEDEDDDEEEEEGEDEHEKGDLGRDRNKL